MNKMYRVEDIFQDIENDDEYCLMVLPQEIMTAAGLSVDDEVSIEIKDSMLIITRR